MFADSRPLARPHPLGSTQRSTVSYSRYEVVTSVTFDVACLGARNWCTQEYRIYSWCTSHDLWILARYCINREEIHPDSIPRATMASRSNTGKKGYDCKFVDAVPNSLICLICTFVAREPQQAICCGKIYCKRCLDDLTAHYSHDLVPAVSTTKCPNCRLPWTARSTSTFPDKKSESENDSLA